jgi:hypothetical protein
MRDRTGTETSPQPEPERDRGIDILEAQERRTTELQRARYRELLAIADAEERGAWPIAACLRSLGRRGPG